MSSSMSSTTSSLAFNFDSNPDPAANATANRNRKKTLFGRFYSRSNSQNELVLSPTHLDSEQGKPIGRKVSQSINHFFSASLGVTGVVKDIQDSMLSFKTLVDLIYKNDLQSLKSFLENRHCNVDDVDEVKGLTALMVASEHGKLEFVDHLLFHGASLAIEDEDGATALHHAARNGHADTCERLLEAGAEMEATDSGGWTPLIWACYKGHLATVDCLVSHRADVNAKGFYNCTGLVWASGRGYYEIAKLLLENQAKVDAGDKHNTTPLIWAARNGHRDIVSILIQAGANVNAIGMHSWTPLIVATSGNQCEIVEEILSKAPDVNRVDKNGMTPLSIASKEGFSEIALKLLKAGAHTNLQDKVGDTCLIYASKGGHKAIVEALLKKYAADVDIKGKDGKTCLQGAIDKNHTEIVRILLNANPDLEIRCSLEGDTALLRAARGRNPEIVQLLLDKKAKPYATNKNNDTALHIAMRAKSKAVVEVFLRNPKNSQFLYRPNNKGETPYNLDKDKGKPILGELFGTRRLNTNEDSEEMYGYDLYSSSLANILTEPSLAMPITVGLYAKWGSGKSFLLGKLREEMKNFTKDWIMEPSFDNSLLLFMVVLHLAFILGLGVWILTYLLKNNVQDMEDAIVAAIGTALLVLGLTYSFFFGVWKFTQIFDSSSLHRLKVFLGERFSSLKLIMNVVFRHPPGYESVQAGTGSNPYETDNVYPLRLLFTEQTKVITSAGGQNSVTQMIGSLYDAIEDHHGVMATRLYRAFCPKPLKSTSNTRLRKICCIPYVVIYLIGTLLTMASVALLTYYVLTLGVQVDEVVTVESGNKTSNILTTSSDYDNLLSILYTIYSMIMIVSVLLIANTQTFYRCFKSLVFSHRKHLQSAVAKLDLVKSEGYLQAVKSEVQLLVNMSKTLDAFTGCQTRLVVVVDGLDSCEQGRVLSVLDAVHMLFSDEGSPFIILLAIDPHVIIKAIELNIHSTFRDTSIGGNAYLRNIVHLPLYLQNSGFRKVHIAQQLASFNQGSSSYRNKTWLEIDSADQAALHRRPSIESNATNKFSKRRESSRLPTRKNSFGSVSSIASKFKHKLTSSNTNPYTGGIGNTDITKMIATDDYMSDVNIRSMRRLMNVVYVMSRLMRAFHIDFNYAHLATWVHMTEQWPYRVSWIIFYVEVASEQLHESDLIDNSKSLYEIYTKVKSVTLTSNADMDVDRDEKKLEAYLKTKQHAMTIKELKIFIPFSINLDPFLKKVIRDEYVKKDLAWFKTNPEQTSEQRSRSREMAVKQKLRQKFKEADLLPSPIRLLPAETLDKWLSKKSVDEVCTLVRQIEGLKTSCVDTYCDAIVSQNISGAVLARCDLQELKSVLNMNFGDWEIFQWTLDSLRQLEIKHKESKSATKLWKSVVQASAGMDNDFDDDGAKYIDNAIYMDEALISGLLSTLNEDAHEDVVTEELLDKHNSRVSRQRQPSETESLNEASDVIYFTKSRVGDRAMSISIGSEDAFNALEKGTDHQLRQPHQQQKKRQQVIGVGAGVELHELHRGSGPQEPQAWISQTAPASPMLGRSRASSVAQPQQTHHYLAQDHFSEGLPASSVERLGDKMSKSVKKGFKHALHKMEQPNTLPPVHRAREPSIESSERKSSSSSSSRDRSKKSYEVGISSKSQGASREESIHGSIELPIFGDDADEDENNISSSPEQETVMPNKESTSRPRVQNLFQ